MNLGHFLQGPQGAQGQLQAPQQVPFIPGGGTPIMPQSPQFQGGARLPSGPQIPPGQGGQQGLPPEIMQAFTQGRQRIQDAQNLRSPEQASSGYGGQPPPMVGGAGGGGSLGNALMGNGYGNITDPNILVRSNRVNLGSGDAQSYANPYYGMTANPNLPLWQQMQQLGTIQSGLMGVDSGYGGG